MVPHDIFVGAVVRIYGNSFQIEDADEFTFRHMEENSKFWVYSKLQTVLKKLSQNFEIISRLILTTAGLASTVVTVNKVEALFQRAGVPVVRQEVITLFRVLDPRKTGTTRMTKVLKLLAPGDIISAARTDPSTM